MPDERAFAVRLLFDEDERSGADLSIMLIADADVDVDVEVDVDVVEVSLSKHELHRPETRVRVCTTGGSVPIREGPSNFREWQLFGTVLPCKLLVIPLNTEKLTLGQ